MIKLKILAISASALLLLLALVMGFLSFRHLGDISAAGSYEDKGVYAFVPYQVLPLQMENTSANNRERRMNPNKTIYTVYYQTTDGSGYKWNWLATDQEQGMEILAKGETVSRRVLTIPSDKTYITVEPEQSAESYTAERKRMYIVNLVLAGAYIVLYTAVWCVLIFRKKTEKIIKNSSQGI